MASGLGPSGFYSARWTHTYAGEWDYEAPSHADLEKLCTLAKTQIVWGGNYLSSGLGPSTKWLIWDKCMTMPTYSDAEIAWTNLAGKSTKMFRLSGNGLMAAEKNRSHPTQKPLALMKWCLSLVPDAKTVLDTYCGSGTILVAAKAIGLTAVGIEIEERYCETVAKRLEQEVFEFPDEKEKNAEPEQSVLFQKGRG